MTKGKVIKKCNKGKQYEIERFQGKHENEYCVYEVKKGVRHGTAELFDDGVLKLRWTMRNGVRYGSYMLFDKGVAARKGRWEDVGQSEERVIENRPSQLVMVVRVDGVVVYEGGFNNQMQRDGPGYEYENGVLKRFGKWEEDELVQLEQRYVDENEMIEYGCGSPTDLLSRRPIYIGGYRRNELTGLMERDGKGRVLSDRTGICIYMSEWRNGHEWKEKRMDLKEGWYWTESTKQLLTSFASTMKSKSGKPKLSQPLTNCEASFMISGDITEDELLIPGNEYNDSTLSTFYLHHFPMVRNVVIGNDCFQHIRLFKVEGLRWLKRLVIGERCFTFSKDEGWITSRKDGTLIISKCDHLDSISIGYNSFSDYHGFVIDKLYQLKSLHIGAYCFCHAPSLSLVSMGIAWLVIQRPTETTNVEARLRSILKLSVREL